MPPRRVKQPAEDALPPRRSTRIRLRTEAAARAATQSARQASRLLRRARPSYVIYQERVRRPRNPRNRASVRGARVQRNRQGNNLEAGIPATASEGTPLAMSSAPVASGSRPDTSRVRGERGAVKRIHRELQSLMQVPIDGCNVTLDDDDMYRWLATIKGPSGTPYEGGLFRLAIILPLNYPFSPPSVFFLTKIYHCNIAATGKICIDIVGAEWSPASTISQVLLAILSLLKDPNPEDPLQPGFADTLLRKPDEYEGTARSWTSQYAIPKVDLTNEKDDI